MSSDTKEPCAYARHFKFAFNLVAGLPVAALAAVPTLAVGFSLWANLGGNPFYFQERVSHDRSPLKVLKFKTMKPLQKGQEIGNREHDALRVTRFSKLCRDTRVDELPQIYYNVLWGTLTNTNRLNFIGPRAVISEHEGLKDQCQHGKGFTKAVLEMRKTAGRGWISPAFVDKGDSLDDTGDLAYLEAHYETSVNLLRLDLQYSARFLVWPAQKIFQKVADNVNMVRTSERPLKTARKMLMAIVLPKLSP